MSGTPCLSGFWLLCYPIIPMYVRARHGLRCGACALCVWCVSKDGAPLQTGFGWGWSGIRIVLEEFGDASNNLKYVHDAFYRVFLLVIICCIDRDETQLLWI